tara:strand:- start:12 stop:1196 length:1185 start_codon:yes stop_codon:yes gene_type:complete
MAEELEEVTGEVTEEKTEQPVEEVVQKVDESKFQSAGDDSVIKIDLSNLPKAESEEVEQQPAEEEKVDVVEEPKAEEEVEDQPVLQEVVEEVEQSESPIEEAIEEVVEEVKATGKSLPENIQKLVDFMEDTGGDLQDYVNLNRDVSKMDDSDVVDEYYRSTKPHLTAEERNFLLEESFGFDEDEDDPKDIRRKKIALKEQVAEARAHLDRQKSKYYEEIKSGVKLTSEQQEAIDFFNKYNKDSEVQKTTLEENKKSFLQKTDKVFNENFKGFDFNVGDKRYRFNVKDVNKVKTTQSDINNFISKFTNKDTKVMEDAAGYHKSLFTAMNPDTIAKHFYEQGKADAIKDRVSRDKNINTNPRQTHSETTVGGVKYRVLGDTSSDMKNRSFKIRKKN